jgi:hypothetical protein
MANAKFQFPPSSKWACEKCGDVRASEERMKETRHRHPNWVQDESACLPVQEVASGKRYQAARAL